MKFEAIYEKAKSLHLVASIITVTNFIGSIATSIANGGVPEGYIPVGSAGLGFILACFLEVCLASAFGWLIVFSISKGHGAPVLMVIVIMLISAWTSFFNIQLLILGKAPSSEDDLSIIVIMGIVFCFCACYLIGSHVEKFKIKFSSVNKFIKSIDLNGVLYFGQTVCFIIIFCFIASNYNNAT